MDTAGRINGIFVIPTRFADPSRIVTGPDGNLWFTEYAYEVRDKPGVQHGGNKIGRITTSRKITEFAVPTPFARADGITVGPDGAVYFTESPAYGAIGRAQATEHFDKD